MDGQRFDITDDAGDNNPDHLFNSADKSEKQKSKFSELIDDIDIEGDPYYLKYYRSFHNHELDTNLVENQGRIVEEDIHRKGAITWLPQGTIALQYYTAERRREIVNEGSLNQFRFSFNHQS